VLLPYNFFFEIFSIKRLAFANLHEYMIKRRMKQRLNWIAVQHRARTVLKYILFFLMI
jgi:polyferredoxin